MLKPITKMTTVKKRKQIFVCPFGYSNVVITGLHCILYMYLFIQWTLGEGTPRITNISYNQLICWVNIFRLTNNAWHNGNPKKLWLCTYIYGTVNNSSSTPRGSLLRVFLFAYPFETLGSARMSSVRFSSVWLGAATSRCHKAETLKRIVLPQSYPIAPMRRVNVALVVVIAGF